MDIKLTAAQEKLIEALKANPGTDAQEHLNHIHNQAIADEMIDRLLKFGILQLNPETGLRELAPAYMVTATVNRRYQFGVIQARIIALLYAASRTEMPWVHGKDLLNKAGSESLRVAALFRGNIGWQELVFSDRRGYYRLRLPLRHIVPVQPQLQFAI